MTLSELIHINFIIIDITLTACVFDRVTTVVVTSELKARGVVYYARLVQLV